jgi:predicted unusual protein kinase regulating ubiquinone biosynthesis (AarF/ABC1/UbiB family)
VVIKIQRPGIEHLVATDLAAVRVVSRWAMLWPLISKRADVPKLIDEFARTLWEELDYRAEADNAERFRELFADDQTVYVPEIYRQYSADRVLTLEDVTSIKITDFDAIDASGVDRRVVARRLLDVYLRMIFDFGFFHADPHPGNLFVYPLPAKTNTEVAGQEAEPEEQPFYIVFVDFGMVGRITDQVKRGLRELLIAVGTRDSKRVLKAYQTLGVLLPSADLNRIEEAQAEAMDYAWGKNTSELMQMSRGEMHDFALKYRDLLYKMPFQVPQDFIYLARAVGMLSGMCTALDSDFNPWEPMAGYGQKLVAQEMQQTPELLLKELLAMAQVAVGLPRQAQDVLSRFQEGRVEVQVAPAEGLARDIHRLESAVVGVTRALIFASLLGASTWLYTDGQTLLGEIGYGLAGIAWLALVFRRR